MKIESNKNWTTCLRLNTGDGSPRVFLLNSHFLGSVPNSVGGLFIFEAKKDHIWSFYKKSRSLPYMVMVYFELNSNHV